MANNNTSTSNGGIGFSGVLTILFIGLKLTGHIAWSWWWVLSPLWLQAVCILVVFMLLLAAFAVIGDK